MRPNKVKQQWRQGQPSVGTWLSLGDPLAAEILAHVGFDWLTVDMEHNAIDLADAQALFQAIATTDTVPMVRVPWNDPQIIKRVLDIGAYGVVIPNVKDRGEAEQAAQACRYPPQGIRGIGTLRGHLYGGPDYTDRANEEIAVIAMIEHIDAVARAEEIMTTPGIDAVFIGPNDLAASMGLPLGLDNPHPEHQAAVARVLEAGKRLGLPVGIHCGSVQAVNQRIAEGFLWLALSSDAGLLAGAAHQAFQQLDTAAAQEARAARREGVAE
ncbi:MAG: aldolase/citrate lyase family protein [Chloroflexota bacterium]|nr:aldolase/citrate lyase family protein [Chloroflexota bacterium]